MRATACIFGVLAACGGDDAITRRTIGGEELACCGDSYEQEGGDAYVRHLLDVCKAIAKP